MAKRSISVIGSGNWGTVAAKMVAENIGQYADLFEQRVRMWVFEEELKDAPFAGRKLSEVINAERENAKYLPGIKLPSNLVAETDLGKAAAAANVLVFVIPHQFLKSTLPDIKANMQPGTIAISLIKGVDFDDKGLVLLSEYIQRELQVPCSVLMGANVASQIAEGEPAEATVGAISDEHAKLFQKMFHSAPFSVRTVKDVAGVEMCGALKNVVAIGAGFSDGIGYHDNTKAALIRIGLLEMKRFAQQFHPPCNDQTYLESCGIADLITTCYGGRNRRLAEAFVKTGKPFDVLEAELLNGQKLQGTLTAKEVHEILVRHNCVEDYPLMTTVYRIAFEGKNPKDIVQAFRPVAGL